MAAGYLEAGSQDRKTQPTIFFVISVVFCHIQSKVLVKTPPLAMANLGCAQGCVCVKLVTIEREGMGKRREEGNFGFEDLFLDE